MAANAFTTLLGDTLQGKDGDVSTATALKGKTVGIYFSAHWCPPCRGFTPKLAETYTKMKAAGKPFEIVFASSDRDQGAFDGYFAEMPWLTLPYSDRDRKEALSKKFKVQGIPTLVILDENGETITVDGREAVGNDPAGEKFPWAPPTFAEALGEEFLGQGGATVQKSALEGKYLALYFSAHWCPPCRGFTPQLVDTYKAMKAAGRDDFEFIFVSSDRDEKAFGEYFADMPWLALPFADRERKSQLSSMFGVRGIPSLVVVDPNGEVVTTKGRGAAGADKTGAEFPWHPKPVTDLCADAGDINEKVSLVALLGGLSAEGRATARAALERVAVAKNAALKAAGEDTYAFYYADSDAGVVAQVRTMTKVVAKEGAAQLLLLDIPDRGGFYVGPEVAEGAVGGAEGSFDELLASYGRGDLKESRKQLG